MATRFEKRDQQTTGARASRTKAPVGVGIVDDVHVPNFFRELCQVMGMGGEAHLGVGELVANACGMGAMLLAVLATTLDNTAQLPGDLRTVVGVSLALSMGVSLIVLSFMQRETYRFFGSPRRAAVVCTAHGLLLGATVLLPLFDVVPGVALACALGIGLGVLLGLACVYWSYVATSLYIPDAASCAILATAGAMLVYALVFTKIPLAAEHLLCTLCPLASAPLLYNRLRNMAVLPEAQGARSYYERRHAWMLYVYKVALPLLCVGVVVHIYLSYAQRSIMFDLDLVHMAGLFLAIALAGIIANCAIYGVRTGVQSFARFLSVVIPLIALVAAPLSPAPAENLTVVNASLLAAVCLIIALSWTFLCAAAVEYSYAPASTFGLGLGSFALGVLVAEPILTFIPNDSPLFILVIGIVCFFMVFGFLPPRPAPNLSRSTYSKRIAERVNAMVAGAGAEGAENIPCANCPENGTCGAGTAGRVTNGVGRTTGTADAGSVAGLAWTTDAPAGRSATAGGAPLGGRATGSGDTGSVGGDVPAGSPRTSGVAETGAIDASGDGATRDQAVGSDRQKGRFVRRCEHVAAMYLLSNRETEVLILLAKGRSMNYIKDALVISEGTAKTHISHVYKKLDVHSRHELVELIESVEVD